jgi:hypothetical protein
MKCAATKSASAKKGFSKSAMPTLMQE